MNGFATTFVPVGRFLCAMALLIALTGAALVAQPVELRSPNEELNGNFGIAVAGIGDINGDGFADVLVGAPFEDPGASPANAGRAYVFSGQGGDTLYSLQSPGEEFNGRFGGAVAGAGDLDGDGVPDLIVGAFLETAGSGSDDGGRVHLFSGADGSLIRTLISPAGDPSGNFGVAVDGIGDVSGDGVPDLVVGALNEDHPGIDNAGRAYILSGASGAVLHTLESPVAEVNGAFGNEVAAIGDITGDGIDDVAVGAFFEEVDPAPFASGQVHLFSGQSGAHLRILVTPNPRSDGQFGGTVAAADDLDGDGVDDLLVGASGERDFFGEGGRAYAISGADGAVIHSLVSPIEEQGGRFGSVGRTGDITGDGVDDIVVGAPGELDAAGRVYVFDGQGGVPLFTLTSPDGSSGGFLGAQLNGVGDVDSDGVDDFIASAAREEANGAPADAGRAWIFRLSDLNPIADSPSALPATIELGRNYPNPFNPGTRVEFGVARAQWVQLAVFDVTGRRVATLVDGMMPAGRHQVTWDGRTAAGVEAASGVYLLRLRGADRVLSRKMMRVR